MNALVIGHISGSIENSKSKEKSKKGEIEGVLV